MPNHTIERISKKHGWHVRTIRSVIDGNPIRTYIGARVKEELERRGIKIGAADGA